MVFVAGHYLKGLYDGLRRGQKILVTGSAGLICTGMAATPCRDATIPKTGRVSRTSPPADAAPDRSLKYLKKKFPDAEAWQVSATGVKDYVTPEGIRVAPALALLSELV